MCAFKASVSQPATTKELPPKSQLPKAAIQPAPLPARPPRKLSAVGPLPHVTVRRYEMGWEHRQLAKSAAQQVPFATLSGKSTAVPCCPDGSSRAHSGSLSF
jgi:hypothetical protein